MVVSKPIRLTSSKARQLSRVGRTVGTGGTSRVSSSSYTYKRLLSEKVFLKVQQRSYRVQGFSLISIDFASVEGGVELRFLVKSVSVANLNYTVLVRVNALDVDTVVTHNATQVGAMLRDSGIQVYCNCPAFLYWGYQYKAEKNNYAAFRLGVAYPKIRNPHLRGYVCKHTYAVLSILSAQWGSIGKQLKDYLTDARRAQVGDALDRAYRSVRVSI